MQPAFADMVYEGAKRLARISGLRLALVFGSVARGEADARSDIDLLLVFDGTKAEQRRAQNEARSVLAALERAMNRGIQAVFTDPAFTGLDRQFIETALREGIIVYGALPIVRAGKLQLEPQALITYDTRACTQSQRSRIERILYGHATVRQHKGKRYRSRSEGLAKLVGGRKIATATLLVPFNRAARICTALRSHGAACRRIDIWISKP